MVWIYSWFYTSVLIFSGNCRYGFGVTVGLRFGQPQRDRATDFEGLPFALFVPGWSADEAPFVILDSLD